MNNESNPAPQVPERRAPDGYKECDKKCGRFVPKYFGCCTVCWTALGDKVNPKCVDWTPPSPHPAVCKAPEWCGKIRTEAIATGTYTGCEYRGIRPVFENQGNSRRWCSPACRDARVPPLPAAPVTTGACLELGPCRCCGLRTTEVYCRFCGRGDGSLNCKIPCKPATNDSGTGAKSVPVQYIHEGRSFPSPEARDAYRVWMAAQSGTPCASPPGLMARPKMSFAPFDDSWAGDAP